MLRPRTSVAAAVVSGLFLAGGLLIASARERPRDDALGPLPLTAEKAKRGSSDAAEIVSIGDVKRALKSHKGRVLVVHLWATWCMPCLHELPTIAKFAREVRPRGIEVLSFSLDNLQPGIAERVGKVIADRASNELTKRIVRIDDPDELITAIDPTWEGTIPALFAFDREGALKGSLIGESDRADLERLVSGLVAERTAPAK